MDTISVLPAGFYAKIIQYDNWNIQNWKFTEKKIIQLTLPQKSIIQIDCYSNTETLSKFGHSAEHFTQKYKVYSANTSLWSFSKWLGLS